MEHKHSVYDTDKHFQIIPQTRKIVNTSGKKKLMRLDHKSERFTFELPRYVEGHDMSLCNVLEVHFNNISEDGNEQKPNMDELTDIQISPDDDSVVIFSWLITENCTQLAGILSFFFRFSCVNDDGTVEYNWHTDSFDGITVGDVKYNSQIVIDFYADIIHTWKKNIVEAAVAEVTPIKEAAVEAQRKAEESATRAAQSEQTVVKAEAVVVQAEKIAVNAKKAAEEAARQAELSRQGVNLAEQNAKTSEQNAAKSAEEAKKAAEESAGVKTINGQTPDENGNVDVRGVDVTAQPGQLIIVKEVDENGKPTAWEAVDRTHWAESLGITELPFVGEWSEEDTDGDGIADASVFVATVPFGLVVGNTYTVKCNGADYTVECLDASVVSGGEMPGAFLGNLAGMGGEDTGEPFMVMEIPEELSAEMGGMYGIIQTMGAVESFAIYGEGEAVHKLPNKFIDSDWVKNQVAPAIATAKSEAVTEATTEANAALEAHIATSEIPVLNLHDYITGYPIAVPSDHCDITIEDGLVKKIKTAGAVKVILPIIYGSGAYAIVNPVIHDNYLYFCVFCNGITLYGVDYSGVRLTVLDVEIAGTKMNVYFRKLSIQ